MVDPRFPNLYFCMFNQKSKCKRPEKDGGQVPASVDPREKSVYGICHVQKRSFVRFQKQPFNTKHRK